MNPAGYACLFFVGGVFAFAAPAGAAERVMAVEDDQTLVLSESGRTRFADILFPDAALAQDWLATHLLQQDIEIAPLGTDRYGRTLIAATPEEAMLRDGVAVLFPQHPILDSWQSAEDRARQEKLGLWANPDFLLTPENAAQHLQ